MKMRVLAAAIACLPALTFAAGPTTNPADLYRPVFKEITTGDDWVNDADDLDALPLDEKAARYLEKRRPVFDTLREAAAMPTADWGPIDGDITRAMASLNGARAAVRMTYFASRYHAAHGRPAEAADDLLLGMAVARHVGQHPLLVCHLVEIGCETGAIDRLARLLPTLPKDVAGPLADRLDRLPASAGWPAVIEGERVFGRLALAKQMNSPAATQPAGLAKAMSDGLGPLYDAAKGRPGETPDELQRDIDAVVVKLAANPMAKVWGPSIGRARVPSAAVEAKFAMLRTAAAIAAHGDGELAKSKDPFGGGPFVRTNAGGGYVLSGKLTKQGEAVTLRVGE